MVRTTLKFTRKNRVLQNMPQVVKAIEAAFQNPVKPHYEAAFQKRITGWKHRVQFMSKKIKTANAAGIFIHAGGANAKYWFWTSLGTKKHPITAVRAPLLRFQLGYSARTQPVDQYGVGSGKASGAFVSAKRVMHPGTKARKFEEGIEKKERPWFFKTMNSTIKTAVRQAKR